MRLVMLGFILLLASCNEGEPPEEIPLDQPAPAEVVELWLLAVNDVDVSALDATVEPVGLAVLAGAENQVRSDEMAGLIETGVTGGLAQGYWQSFRDDFEAIRDIDIGSIVVGDERPVASNPDYVTVTISTPEQSSLVVLQTNSPVGWQIDMVATIGPGLASQLRTYLESALDGEFAEAIADAYRNAVVPGLDAAIPLNPGNALLVFETEFIRQLVGG